MSTSDLRNRSTHNCGITPRACVSGMEWNGMEWKGWDFLSISSPNRSVSDGPRRLALTC